MVSNEHFLKILASITARPVEICLYPNTALLGAAACVAAGLKWFNSLADAINAICPNVSPVPPDPVWAAAYERLYLDYLNRYGSAIGYYRRRLPRGAGPKKRARERRSQ